MGTAGGWGQLAEETGILPVHTHLTLARQGGPSPGLPGLQSTASPEAR